MSFAQNDYLMVKKALGFDSERSEEFITMEILHSTRNSDNYHALVDLELHTNGGCRDRGVCGCGVDRKYASITLNKFNLIKSKEVLWLTCRTHLESNLSDEGNTFAIIVDDISKSCSSTSRMDEVYFYKYNKEKPELGIQNIGLKEYEGLTKRSVAPVKTDDISQDKCFYNNYLRYKDDWGGAYRSELIFKKLKDGKIGEFVGYWRNGNFIPDSNQNIKPPKRKQITKLLKPIKKISKKKLLNQALSHYKNNEFKQAEALYQKAIASYRNEIFKKNLSVINDLALTLYKQKKYFASESWSEMLLKYKNADNYIRHAAAANYNLGLVSEVKNNRVNALDFYKRSYDLRHTSSAKKAIERLE